MSVGTLAYYKRRNADIDEKERKRWRKGITVESRLDETKKEARTRSMVRGSPFAASLTGATDLPEQK